METRFITPALVAAALHACAFFGTDRPLSKVPPPITHHQKETDTRIVLTDFGPPPVEQDESEVVRRGTPDVAPTSEDIIRPNAAHFQQIVVPAVTSAPVSLTTIPIEPFGRPDGDPNVAISPGPAVFNIRNLDHEPKTRSQVAPVYPTEAKQDGASAEVLVEFVVDEAGNVLNPHIVRSSDRRFEAATLRAVSRWRFEPGRIKNKPVRFRMVAPVVFSLAG